MGKTKLQELLDGYAEDHQHPTNLLIHKFGVPLVLFHFVAMFDWIHLYPSLYIETEPHSYFALSLGHVVALWIFVWYLSLSVKLAVIVAFFSILCFALAMHTPFSWVIFIAIVAWVLQLVGHAVYEKRSPSFFTNLFQLLIGPLFVAAVLSGHQESSSE